MMSISALSISRALEHAFRAALLLTGRADLAENAVLEGIAGSESNEDLEKALIGKTVESVFRRRADFPNPSEQALALLPRELHWLMSLAPVSRDCYVLRVLLGMRPAICAAILVLTIEEFEESLCAGFQQLAMLEHPKLVVRSL